MTTPRASTTAKRSGWQAGVLLRHSEVDCWNFGAAQARLLEELLPGLVCHVCPDAAAFRALLPELHMALVWRFEQSDFALAPRLRIVATPAAGRDYFRVQPPAGVSLFYGRFHGEIMAETAVAMVLGMVRGILPANTGLRGEPWPRRELSKSMRPLRGSHVVILGFGHIGAWVGRLLKPFGVRLTGICRRPRAERPPFFEATDRLLTADCLDAVLPETDHLVLVLPGDTGTDRILEASRLARLPRHATVVNLGRGNAIDAAALEAALRQGALAGACLDVFPEEPLPADSSLRGCPNLWLLPHAAAISPTYMELFVRDLAVQVVNAGLVPGRHAAEA